MLRFVHGLVILLDISPTFGWGDAELARAECAQNYDRYFKEWREEIIGGCPSDPSLAAGSNPCYFTLNDLFDYYGSDKGSLVHNYGRIYEGLLGGNLLMNGVSGMNGGFGTGSRCAVRYVLEIGVGAFHKTKEGKEDWVGRHFLFLETFFMCYISMKTKKVITKDVLKINCPPPPDAQLRHNRFKPRTLES